MRGSGGLRLHIRISGEIGRPPLVLCHGYGLSAIAWNGIAAHVDGRQCIALDLRGHGDSDWDPAGRYGREILTDDIRSVLDALAIERCVMVGHSLGGDLAGRITAEEAERVAGLVMIDIGPDLSESGMKGLRDWTARVPQRYDDPAEYREWLEALHPLVDGEMIGLLLEHGLRPHPDGGFERKVDPIFREVMFADEEKEWAQPAVRWAALEALIQPFHIVRGESSSILTREAASKMARAARMGATTEVPNAGHSVMLDNPHGLATVLAAFADSLS